MYRLSEVRSIAPAAKPSQDMHVLLRVTDFGFTNITNNGFRNTLDAYVKYIR